MRRFRPGLVLVGICVGAILIGVLQLLTTRTPLPTGSSYSAEQDGALALVTWVQELGGTVDRHRESAATDAAGELPRTLLLIQPERMVDRATRVAYDDVPRAGGTLIVAGDSPAWLLYARALGLTPTPVEPGPVAVQTPDGLNFELHPRFALDVPADAPSETETLLSDADGRVFGIRRPYRGGTLVVLSTPEPLLNGALRDDAAARFVYRTVVTPALTGPLAVDEAHHSFAPTSPGVADAPASADELLLRTPVGRAILFALVVGFVGLVLTGRRLGPAVPGRTAVQTRRTMYEHVQMLASLYRRGRQFGTVRAGYERHYARTLARGQGGPPARVAQLTAAVDEIAHARSEPELIAAVGRADEPG
jgi:hypothetical protein